MGDVDAGSFGAQLRRLRERRALTQEELAERAGLTVNAIGALERGVRRRPYPHTVRALAEALGLDDGERALLSSAVPGRAARVATPVAGSAPWPASGSAAAEPGAAPAGLAGRPPLIGREADVAAVAGLLGERRLVTLTGPGGVGKTSLALEVAARCAPLFPHGCAVVELAALRDPARVLDAVAGRLGVPERRRREMPVADALAEHLAGRRLLLVLDNLEQVAGCAPDVATLVARCPGLVVLATSRSPLRIRAEHEVVVEPLEVPDAWAADDPDGIGRAPAVAMFLDRAVAMGAPLVLTRDNAGTIAAICWRLDGLPLALELAAARARLLEPAALLERLDEAMSAGGIRDLPERQQSVQDTVDWSHELLDAAQRRLFARLAAFRGSFSLDAAEAVGGAVLADLGGLVEQSLVARAPAGSDGRTRFRLLEPIRQYALRRLGGSPDAEAVADRHAEYFRAAAARAGPGLRGADLAARLDALEEDHADLGAAVERLLDTGDGAAAATMVWDFWLYLALRGHASDGLAWVDRARAADLPAVPRCHALAAAGALAYVLGDLPRARADAGAALDVARALGDARLIAETAAVAGLVAVFVGDVQAAERIVAAAPDGVAAAPDGVAAAPEGTDTTEVEAGELLGRALLLGVWAQTAILSGDLPAAVRWLAAAERAARDGGNPFAVAMILNMRATVTEAAGDHRATARLLAESIALSVAARSRWTLAYALPALAAVAVRLGDAPAAARLLGAAAALTGAPAAGTGEPRGPEAGRVPASRRAAAGDAAAVRESLGEAAFRAAFEDGRLLGLDRLAELARRLTRSAPG